MSWLAFALIVCGWAGVRLSQAKHHAASFGSEGTTGRRRRFAFAGGALLALAFAILVWAEGWEFGPVRWTVLLCLGALAWTLRLALAKLPMRPGRDA